MPAGAGLIMSVVVVRAARDAVTVDEFAQQLTRVQHVEQAVVR